MDAWGGAWRVFSVNLVGEPDNRMSDPTIDRLTENTSENHVDWIVFKSKSICTDYSGTTIV